MTPKTDRFIAWVKKDFHAHPLRFCIECLAWILSIGCSLTMAITVPNPPLQYLYPVWITGCIMYLWAAKSRGSFGMVANYLLLASIDIVGAVRIWTV